MARAEFSNPVKREARERAAGFCECHRVPQLRRPDGCGQRLGPANTFYEHVIQDAAGGKPTLDNCAVLVKTCWREKTDHHDQPVVAKTKRLRDRDTGIGRRNGPPMPGSRNSPWRKPMSGKTERRL